MNQCKEEGCISYALNDDKKSGRCDVCLYKIPLMELLARIHRDGGRYVARNGLRKSVRESEKIISNSFLTNEVVI